MTAPTRIKGGKVSVKLDLAETGTYTRPCGFNSKTVTFTKGLEEVNLGDCDDPDAVNWVGRDAVSLSISVNGEGVLAVESIEDWQAAWESVESVPCKIEIELPLKTITYTGRMHVETMEHGAPDGRTVTNNVSMQSDGEMVRTSV